MTGKFDFSSGRMHATAGLIAAFSVLAAAAPAWAAQDAQSANMATMLLVVSFVLCVCILAVSGFTLWQSHRYYLDTARLSRDITATTMDLHHKVVDLILNLKDFLAHEVRMSDAGAPASSRTRARTDGAGADETVEVSRRVTASRRGAASRRIDEVVAGIGDTESKIRAIEDTLARLNDQLDVGDGGKATDLARQIEDLNDIEFAVLFKILQDPRFFERNSFSSFGATPKVLDTLLSRQLIVFDMEGKAEVPDEVAVALRQNPPTN
jgi:hypothetical protein